jgi:hypothetical protein
VGEKHSWVIDLISSSDDNSISPTGQYRSKCRELVESLFRTKIMLGFAVGKDLAKLEAWLGRALDRSRCLDLQVYFSTSTSSVPGLASCSHQVLEQISSPVEDSSSLDDCHRPSLAHNYELDKTQQRSDWNRRPLTTSQLAYAALDAALLPVLLAEQIRIKN